MPFQKFLQEAEEKSPDQSGLQWFFNEIKKAASDINYRAFSAKRDPVVGSMFFFVYSAKWAEKLPYWDRFPLVIISDLYTDGFLGLNFHYLTPFLRLALLSSLKKYVKRDAKREEIMKISYSILKNASRQELIMPCIHRYLTSHLRSRLVLVDPVDWGMSVKLPVADFQKGKPTYRAAKTPKRT